MHGLRYIRILDAQLINENDTFFVAYRMIT
jgi:hypothetical protein